MIAFFADGPLADREIEVAEPRPTMEMADDGHAPQAEDRPVHRYRLAGVELEPVASSSGRFRRIAVYVHAPGKLERAVTRRAA